jgi:type IVB pilus formation R64 PilN family outer membrane protein
MRNLKMKTFTLTSVAIASLLSGCAATERAEIHQKETSEKSKTLYDGALLKTSSAALDSSRSVDANFGKVQKNWVNPNPLPRNDLETESKKLPKIFQDKVSLTMPGKVSLVEVISELQRSQGIKFTLNQDIYNSSTGIGSIISASGGGSSGGSSTAPAGVLANSIGTNGAIPVFVNDFVYRGSLENALNLMASKANISWKWNGSSIEIFRFETKSYNISAMAGKTVSTSTVSMSGSSTGTSTGAGSQQTAGTTGVTRTSDLTTWDEVKTYLLSMTSPQGSVAILESSGLITVKDTPIVQEHIAKAVQELNDVLSKQVYMDVDVYSVAVNDEDNYGFSWNLAWATAAQNFGLTLTNGAQMNVPSPSNIGVNILNGPFSGSSATLKALSSIGKTNIVNHFTVSTLNGQTTPVGNNQKIDYVQSITVTQPTVAGGSPTTAINTGSVYQGITMAVTPRIQRGTDKVLLEYSMSLNTLDGMTPYSDASGNQVSLPKTTIKNILQRSALRSGQTLVLSGFKQSGSVLNNSGVGSPSNQLLGGARDAQNSSQYLVITVTPYIGQESQ